MVSTLYRILIVLLLLSLGPMLEAQVIPPRRLTMQDAVNLALRNNPELESSRLEAERARARVREAWGYTMPSLGLSGQYTRAIKDARERLASGTLIPTKEYAGAARRPVKTVDEMRAER